MPPSCLTCLVVLDQKSCGDKFSFIDRSFPTLCRTFANLNMILPKCTVKAKTKIQFCDACQEMLNEIDDIYGEIDLLQNKIEHLKTQLQLKVYKSRTSSKEKRKDKNIARTDNDEFMEMVRDLITGFVLNLPRLKPDVIYTNAQTFRTFSLALPEELSIVRNVTNIDGAQLVGTKVLTVEKNEFGPISFADSNLICPWELEKLCSTGLSLNNNDANSIKPNNFAFDEIFDYASSRVEENSTLDQNVQMEEPLWSHDDNQQSEGNENERDPDYKLPIVEATKEEVRKDKSVPMDNATVDTNETISSKRDRERVKREKIESSSIKSPGKRRRKSAETESKARDKLKVDITPDGKILYRGFEILQTDGGFRCSICMEKKLFKLRISAVLHIMKNHMDCKKFACDICCKQFLHLSNLKNHQKVHSTEKSLMCDVCGKVFKLRETLLGHRKTHLNLEVKKFSCQYCDKTFLHQRDCTVHVRTHTKERPFQCHVCPKSFIVLTLLNRHLLSHSRDEGLV